MPVSFDPMPKLDVDCVDPRRELYLGGGKELDPWRAKICHDWRIRLVSLLEQSCPLYDRLTELRFGD